MPFFPSSPSPRIFGGILAPSGASAGGQRTSHPEIGASRVAPRTRVLAARQQEKKAHLIPIGMPNFTTSIRSARSLNSTGIRSSQSTARRRSWWAIFKNNGREWQAKDEETCVNVFDFLSLAEGKAIAYGVCDLVHKSGFVKVGIDHETAEFAVESIRRWWQTCGKKLYPEQKALLITADGGWSNLSLVQGRGNNPRGCDRMEL
jgi:hypothetical protein